jgi:1,4-alpha-glucan branching enzyme
VVRDPVTVLKRTSRTITFVLPADVGPVSVVGDFNGWDPHAHPMRKRSNGTRSVTVEVPPGSHPFRYLAEPGVFFDDTDADAIEPNGYGDTHSVLCVT